MPRVVRWSRRPDPAKEDVAMNDSRKHGSGRRPESHGGGKGRPAPGGGGRHGAPVDQTGAETNYIVKNMEARTPRVVRLVDNEEVRGWIEYYDRKMIKLNRRHPPHLFIRKENIKYIYKDEEAVAVPREKP
jgi:small nuclear ribonucleoprotein (snRNP)-like protein